MKEHRATPAGVRVSSVGPDTPAAEAGIHPGDLIFAVGQRPIDGVADVQAAVEFAAIGQELPLTLERQGKRMEVKVKPRAVAAPTGAMRTPRINAAPGAAGPGSPPPIVPPGALPDLPDD